jgi:hypothetical protein
MSRRVDRCMPRSTAIAAINSSTVNSAAITGRNAPRSSRLRIS